jgi:splicing factor 3A subunit 3
MGDGDNAAPPAVPAAVDVSDLASNPLFCVPCDKLFTKQSLFDSHLPGKKHVKAAEKHAQTQATAAPAVSSAPTAAAGAAAGAEAGAEAVAGSSSSSSSSGDTASGAAAAPLSGRLAVAHAMARLEFRAAAWCGLLRPVLDATLVFLDKRRTATFEELAELEGEGGGLDAAAEIAAAALRGPGGARAGEEEEEDEDGGVATYNPLNLPLGWDGNPIPYWLYKLHQLNKRHKCDICNEEFRGTRNFYKHFREWKHTYFLKCHGIPNSEHFVNVSTLDDAKALYARLRNDAAAAEFRTDQEEVEDALGNVYSKDTYEELKSKGLVI